jgi:hypothetical protein
VILDTEGNIFGGFTPLKWESRRWDGKLRRRNNCMKADDSQKSFIFTLKNPHNVQAKKFALKTERKWEAIFCDSQHGPYFGGYPSFGLWDWNDICVCDDCNANTGSFTSFGISYINDTGLDGKTFFTGSEHFKVQEIEIFEITD